MAIDLETETIITLREAAKRWPAYRRDAQGTPIPTHPRRIIRAIIRGDLEGVKYGAQWCTSIEAIARMVERDTAREIAAFREKQGLGVPLAKTPKQRAKATEKARRDLKKQGV